MKSKERQKLSQNTGDWREMMNTNTMGYPGLDPGAEKGHQGKKK